MTREEFINWFEERFVLTKNNIDEFGQLYEEVTKPHWISVEDELPKIEEADCEWVGSKDVLAILWNGEMSVGRYERENSTGEHYWVLYNIDKDHQVTHWMSLPAPPKKGDEE